MSSKASAPVETFDDLGDVKTNILARVARYRIAIDPAQAVLDLREVGITQKNAQAVVDYLLIEIPDLRRIDVSDNKIGVKGGKQIARLKTVQELTAKKTQLKSHGVLAVSRMPELRLLDAPENPMDDIDALRLSKSKTITHMRLPGSIGDLGMKNLSYSAQLNSLHIEGEGVGAAGAAHVTGFPALRYIEIHTSKIGNAGAWHIAQSPTLQSVGIYHCGLDDEGVGYLAEKFELKSKPGENQTQLLTAERNPPEITLKPKRVRTAKKAPVNQESEKKPSENPANSLLPKSPDHGFQFVFVENAPTGVYTQTFPSNPNGVGTNPPPLPQTPPPLPPVNRNLDNSSPVQFVVTGYAPAGSQRYSQFVPAEPGFDYNLKTGMIGIGVADEAGAKPAENLAAQISAPGNGSDGLYTWMGDGLNPSARLQLVKIEPSVNASGMEYYHQPTVTFSCLAVNHGLPTGIADLHKFGIKLMRTR